MSEDDITAFIAEQVMGWTCEDGDQWFEGGERRIGKFKPTQDMNHALKALEKVCPNSDFWTLKAWSFTLNITRDITVYADAPHWVEFEFTERMCHMICEAIVRNEKLEEKKDCTELYPTCIRTIGKEGVCDDCWNMQALHPYRQLTACYRCLVKNKLIEPIQGHGGTE